MSFWGLFHSGKMAGLSKKFLNKERKKFGRKKFGHFLNKLPIYVRRNFSPLIYPQKTCFEIIALKYL